MEEGVVVDAVGLVNSGEGKNVETLSALIQLVYLEKVDRGRGRRI